MSDTENLLTGPAMEAARRIVDLERLNQARAALSVATDGLDLEWFTHRSALDEMARADELLQSLQVISTPAQTAIAKAERWLIDPEMMVALYTTTKPADDGGEGPDPADAWKCAP